MKTFVALAIVSLGIAVGCEKPAGQNMGDFDSQLSVELTLSAPNVKATTGDDIANSITNVAVSKINGMRATFLELSNLEKAGFFWRSSDRAEAIEAARSLQEAIMDLKDCHVNLASPSSVYHVLLRNMRGQKPAYVLVVPCEADSELAMVRPLQEGLGGAVFGNRQFLHFLNQRIKSRP